MKKLIMLSNQLESLQQKVEAKIEAINKEIQERVEFPCEVYILEGDGICLVNLRSSMSAPNAAPLAECLDIINKEGKLSNESFNQITI